MKDKNASINAEQNAAQSYLGFIIVGSQNIQVLPHSVAHLDTAISFSFQICRSAFLIKDIDCSHFEFFFWTDNRRSLTTIDR